MTNQAAPEPELVAQLRADLRQSERQMEAVRRISAALFSHSSVDEMVRETLTVAIEVLDADSGSLLLHDRAAYFFAIASAPPPRGCKGFPSALITGLRGIFSAAAHRSLSPMSPLRRIFAARLINKGYFTFNDAG